MRIGRRYSRSAGTRSPERPPDVSATWFGTERAVSPGAGVAGGVAGPVPPATVDWGVPSTGTGPGGGAVGRGFPSASTTPASQGAAGAGTPSPASPLGRPPGVASPGTATVPAGRRSDAWAA